MNGADAGVTAKLVGSRHAKITRPMTKSCQRDVIKCTVPRRDPGRLTHTNSFRKTRPRLEPAGA